VPPKPPRANLLSSEETREGCRHDAGERPSLRPYITLRELDYELEIARGTLETRRVSLQLVQSRQGRRRRNPPGFAASRGNLFILPPKLSPRFSSKAEQTEEPDQPSAGERIRARVKSPGAGFKRGTCSHLKYQPALTSALLQRRPDIRAAEQNLIAANAEIGVARGRVLPTVEPERVPGVVRAHSYPACSADRAVRGALSHRSPSRYSRPDAIKSNREISESPKGQRPWCNIKGRFRVPSRKYRTP